MITTVSLERLSFVHWIAFALLSKISWLYLWGVYFCAVYSVLLICMSTLLQLLHYLDFCSFIIHLEVRYSQFSSFVLRYCVEYFGSFVFPYRLSNRFVNMCKIACWDFDWDHFESIDKIGKNWHLNNIGSSNLWTQISIYLEFFVRFLQFSVHRSCTYFVSYMPKYFIFLGAIVNGIIFKNSNSYLLICRKSTDF